MNFLGLLVGEDLLRDLLVQDGHQALVGNQENNVGVVPILLEYLIRMGLHLFPQLGKGLAVLDFGGFRHCLASPT